MKIDFVKKLYIFLTLLNTKKVFHVDIFLDKNKNLELRFNFESLVFILS